MSEVSKNIDELVSELRVGRTAIIEKAAEQILQAAVEIVPVDTGELAESGHIEGGNIIFSAPHALVIHETHDQGFKFLVRAAESVDIIAIAEEVLNELS